MTKLIFSLVFALGIFLTFLVPPFQKPDELTHFRKTVALANGNLCLFKNQKTYYYQKYLDDLEKTINSFKLIHNPSPNFNYKIYFKNIFDSKKNLQLVKKKSDVICLIPTFPFLPQALTIKLVTSLGFNEYITFFLGRLVIFLVCFIWLIFLYKKTPEAFKNILLLTFALPMSVHQITSYSYDPIHIMLGLSVFVFIIKLLKISNVTMKQLGLLFLLILIFVLSKEGFYIFFILPLVVPYKKINKNKSTYIKRMAIYYLVFLLLFLIFRLNSLQQLYVHIQTQPAAANVNPSSQMYFLLRNPLFAIRLFINTIFARTDFYLSSLIGEFGWLEYSLNLIVYIFYASLFILIIFKTNIDKKLELSKQTLFILFIFLSVTFIYFLTYFYLAWTKVGNKVVEGIQGRYFITLVPFLFLFLLSLKKYPKIISIMKIIVLLFIFSSIILTVLRRYYLKV